MLIQTANKEQPERYSEVGKIARRPVFITVLKKESGEKALYDLHLRLYLFLLKCWDAFLTIEGKLMEEVVNGWK